MAADSLLKIAVESTVEGAAMMVKRRLPSANRPPPPDNRNLLLAALPADEYQRIAPFLETIPLKLKSVLHRAGDPIEHVYFLEEGIASVVTGLQDTPHQARAAAIDQARAAAIQDFVGVTVKSKLMDFRQESLKDEVVEASAGGGMVTVQVTGDLNVKSITIDPQAVDPEEVELLQDMVLAAVNEGLRSAQELASSKLGGIAGGLGGLGLPGL